MKKLKRFLTALLLTATLAFSSAPVSGAEGNTRVGVFLINWSDDTTLTTDPAVVYDEMFVNTRSVAAFFRDTTYGQIELYGDVLGQFTVNPPKSAGCSYSLWSNDARNQLAAQGIDPLSYDMRVYIWRNVPTCAWSGRASGNDVYSNVNLHASVISHELGHSFGLTHASVYRCLDENGLQVTLATGRGGTCTTWTYGDRYDTMGNSSFLGFNAIHRTMAGWLPKESTQLITSPGTYTVLPLEVSSGIRQLEVKPPKQGRNQPQSFCLEARQSIGWDQFNETGQYGNPWATNGIHVRLSYTCLTTNGLWFGADSIMLDGTPNSETNGSLPGQQLLDWPLPVGQTLIGPGVRIKLVSISQSGATVEVTYPKGNK